MEEDKKPTLMRNILLCSVKMERLVARIYARLAERLPPLEAIAARHIARESSNHALFLEEVLKALGVSAEDVDCSAIVGRVFDRIEKIIENIDSMSVEELRDELRRIETELGEETYHYIMFPLIKDIFNNNSKIINIIIDEIVCEEKYHHELVEELSLAREGNHKEKTEH